MTIAQCTISETIAVLGSNIDQMPRFFISTFQWYLRSFKGTSNNLIHKLIIQAENFLSKIEATRYRLTTLSWHKNGIFGMLKEKKKLRRKMRLYKQQLFDLMKLSISFFAVYDK